MSWPNPEIPSAPDSEPFYSILIIHLSKLQIPLPDCLHSFLFVCINFCLSNLALNLYFGIYWLGLLILHLLANWEAYWTEFDLQCVCQTQTQTQAKSKYKGYFTNTFIKSYLLEVTFYPDIQWSWNTCLPIFHYSLIHSPGRLLHQLIIKKWNATYIKH